MSCLSLMFLRDVIIQIIVICALVAVIQLLVPWLVSFTGWPMLGQIIMIILWAIIAIMIVYLIFALLACLLGGSGSIFRLRSDWPATGFTTLSTSTTEYLPWLLRIPT